jgi:hypothetical protein
LGVERGEIMQNRRKIAIAASILCVLLAPLVLGPFAAQADELADLRANQQLLQQRIDQLAQGAGSIPSLGGGYVGGVSGAGAYPGPGHAKTAGAGIVGGSFPRSFLIPGTDTSIRVGGNITMDVTYFMTGGNPHNVTGTSNFGNNGAVNSAQLHQHVALVGAGFVKTGNPNRSLGDQVTNFTPQQSKVNFESRTPTAWGEARTFMEFDWANGNQFVPGNGQLCCTDNLIPRLRFAYATLGGLLAGQANSNFNDPDASTENISFGGMVGDPGVTRIPQVRYTWPLAPWGGLGAFSVSAEAPETEGWTPATGIAASDAASQNPALSNCTATTTTTITPPGTGLTATSASTCALGSPVDPFKAPVPRLTAAWYIPQPWGHMDFSVIVSPEEEMKDGRFVDRTFTGEAGHFGGDYKPGWFGWSKDHITWQFEYGDGVAGYIGGNSTMFSIVTNYPAVAPATPALAKLVRAQTTVQWGGNTGYQHWWTPTLRSNANFGILHHDINNLGGADGFVCSGANKFSGGGGCGLNKELVTSAVNLIWNPVPFADIGIEYVWAHRVVLSNLKGDVNGIISRFRVNF